MTGVLVKLDSGIEIEFEYEDLLAVRRSDTETPARIELILTDSAAADLIDQLLDTNYRA